MGCASKTVNVVVVVEAQPFFFLDSSTCVDGRESSPRISEPAQFSALVFLGQV